MRSEVNVRPKALTMPSDNEPASPKGLPMATTNWPTRTASESPNGIGGAPAGNDSTRMTPRSLSTSVPMVNAARRSPLGKTTSSRPAPATTWLLVTMWPWSSKMKPVPVPTGLSAVS